MAKNQKNNIPTFNVGRFFNPNNTLKEEWTFESLKALSEDERYAFWYALVTGGLPRAKRRAICDNDEFPESSRRVNQFLDWYHQNGETFKDPH